MSREDVGTVPRHMRPVIDAVVGLTDTFCRVHLTEEYAHLCHRLAAALGRGLIPYLP